MAMARRPARIRVTASGSFGLVQTSGLRGIQYHAHTPHTSSPRTYTHAKRYRGGTSGFGNGGRKRLPSLYRGEISNPSGMSTKHSLTGELVPTSHYTHLFCAKSALFRGLLCTIAPQTATNRVTLCADWDTNTGHNRGEGQAKLRLREDFHAAGTRKRSYIVMLSVNSSVVMSRSLFGALHRGLIRSDVDELQAERTNKA